MMYKHQFSRPTDPQLQNPTVGQTLYQHGHCLAAILDTTRAHRYHVLLRNGPDYVIGQWDATTGTLEKIKAAYNRANAQKQLKELLG